MTPAFRASHGIVYADTARLSDHAATLIAEVFRVALRAAYQSGDWTAHEAARAPLWELKKAQQDAEDYRRGRARRLRLEALTAEMGRAVA